MIIDNLQAELQEIEKGCKNYDKHQDRTCGEKYGLRPKEIREYIEKEKRYGIWLCPTCQAKIEYIKKGISACEEAISKRNQEILEIIEKKLKEVQEDKVWDDFEKYMKSGKEIILEELKKQITNSEEKE